MNNAIAEHTTSNGMTFVLDMNALVIYEKETGKNALMTIAAAHSGFGVMSITDQRAMLYAGLKRHNPDITLEEAGDILPDNMWLFAAAMSDGTASEEEAPVGKPKAAPRKSRKKN